MYNTLERKNPDPDNLESAVGSQHRRNATIARTGARAPAAANPLRTNNNFVITKVLNCSELTHIKSRLKR